MLVTLGKGEAIPLQRGPLSILYPYSRLYSGMLIGPLLFPTLLIVNYLSSMHILVFLVYRKLLEGRSLFCVHTTHKNYLEHLKNSVNTCDELITTGH